MFQANPTLHAVERHAVDYDPTQNGVTFRDFDGDALQYSVTISDPNNDLRVAGQRIVGTPMHVDENPIVTITASDGHGGTISDSFQIIVAANAKPWVSRPNRVLFTHPGEHVDYDLTQAGTTFADANGDALSYSTVVKGAPPGLSLIGDRVVGSMSAVGFAAFEITASDGYGGTVVDKFGVAIAAPEPGRPILPSTIYSYADDEQPLPYNFRLSLQAFAPFWDTTTGSFGGPDAPSNAGATLGRVLFYDKRLSITNTHSCSSCHQQAHNFASPERFNTGVLGVPLPRNSMSLANARYNLAGRYFIDERVQYLEGLVLRPIEEQTELGMPLPMLVDKLAATDFYPPLFALAFGTPEITPERIRHALVQFVRSLISYRSRYDQVFNPMDSGHPLDPATVFTPAEDRGAHLFTSFYTPTEQLQPGACFQCHRTHVQLMDRPSNDGLDVQSADPGNEGKFRTASLRNIAVSGPYMHDGRFATLREVIEHYDHGIQDSPQLSPELREIPDGLALRLNLSESDKDALEAFLNTLTDTAFLSDPRFSNPFP